jgi:peroxiredoxin
MKTEKLAPGSIFPKITVRTVAGEQLTLGGAKSDAERWQLVVIYRGKHCPICAKYLATLKDLQSDFGDQNVDVFAISGDGIDKAKTQVAEGNLGFPVGYDLQPVQMEQLGLYISDPRSPQETDQPFPEPGLFFCGSSGWADSNNRYLKCAFCTARAELDFKRYYPYS